MKQHSKHIQDIAGKKYLTIGELAEKLGTSIEVIRKWEKDFPRVIRPLRTKGDTRLYDVKQQEQVAMIFRLLRQEGMTIAGAQQRLRNGQTDEERTQSVINQLKALRADLLAIIQELNQISQEEDNL